MGKLIYHARHWLDGRPQVLADVRRYLELAASLYRETQEHYHVMASVSAVWARAALEALLALDIIQVRAVRADGKPLAKAVLLPTHPLHLWRNERLSTLLRGLASSSPIASDERETIRHELERPEHFLSVVRLSSMPEGRGLGQMLPYTNEIEGLPVFENLSNVCSGADGVHRLGEALDQFIIHNPNRPFPLRLAVVNPPAGDDLPTELVKLLKKPQYRGGQRLSSIHLDLYASGQHVDRLRDSLRFTKTQREDEVQEKIAADRLLIRTHDEDLTPATSLEKVVQRLRERPSHLVALFDESTIELRQRTVGRMLPMSPFCVRYDVQVDKFSGGITLEPQPGESPFSEFLQLMNELEGHQRDGAVQAYADAEGLAKTADALLQGDQPASTWLFLADRALPSEAGMRSVRIWERREGLRDTFLAARDFASLARLLRPVFARCNLTLDPPAMERLLHQGARLLGTGLLSLVKKQDGLPDQKQVIGLAGLLFAAREFQHRQPGALVLSVDHPLAKLWLRTGGQRSAVRCDLLVLWRNPVENAFELTAVEAKASDSDSLNDATKRIPKAVAQIGHTLEAIDDGLAGTGDSPPSPLSVPRCEMLKQTLARAAQSRTGDASVDRKNRRIWGAWLQELFGEPAPTVRLQGCVVSVLLRRASRGTEEGLAPDAQWPMVHRILGELELDELLHDPTPPPPSPPSSSSVGPAPSGRGERVGQVSLAPELSTPLRAKFEDFSPSPAATVASQQPAMATDIEGVDADPAPAWPPAVNALGLIGQDEAVKRLVEQAVFAHTTEQRFPDKLLVGPAGVGKSTLARKIGELLSHEPLFFSGADLRKPVDLVQRLTDKQLLDEVGEAVHVKSALLFIDEVHGISPAVATSLLSAMDDRRTTTIDGKLYDFNQAVFLVATTDPGQLSEAFQSRPDKTWLRPYTLHELAGILWLHGKDCLDGAELSQDACYEIAARNQCNPRRSVRQLTQTLVPHFFSRAMESTGGKPTLRQTATWLDQVNIASFYDNQGTDPNGLDDVAVRFLRYLKQQGAASEPTLRQALGLAHPKDFVETSEYLVRLGLIETSSAGRRLTRQGERYLKSDTPPDLRARISRAR
ncbi:MAG: AAA family ATPase [Pseudomonadota bacterium]|nr:AAA family ATPase [Pseudomonadota bacterium]